MSTEPPEGPQPKTASPEFSTGGALETLNATPLMENIAKLETDLDAEKEERREERFYWICGVAISFDVIAIQAVSGSWLFAPVFMLQLILLVGIAQRLGVDWAVQMIGALFHWMTSRGKPGG
ncbi:hypothetical protein [Tropicimonas sp. IMCC34011]|uniref:hypothetical protein n=1 Tax=Tropicimonas sp. IMCC34011 TaxID=2248759 RepID=UPI000E24E332|nr:hypothetical protein [Tropicimonas sp. IMCC34011]